MGMRFTYSVAGDVLRTDRANQNLSRSNFEKVLPLLPLSGPGEISNYVRGSAYVWTILKTGESEKGIGSEPHDWRMQLNHSPRSWRLICESVIASEQVKRL
jgi:hypothetical protein